MPRNIKYDMNLNTACYLSLANEYANITISKEQPQQVATWMSIIGKPDE